MTKTSKVDALVKRLDSVTAFYRFETGDRVAAAGCLAQEAKDRIEALTAEIERLREAAIALRDDMMERAQIKIDVVNGEEYRIVNAGRGAWENFCAALKGQQP